MMLEREFTWSAAERTNKRLDSLGVTEILGSIFNYLATKEQMEAAREGQELTAEQIAAAQQAAFAGADSATDRLYGAMGGIQGNLQDAYFANQDYLSQGYGTARGDIMQSGALGADALAYGQQGGLSALYGGAGQGIDYLSGAQQGVDRAINSGVAGASGLLMNRQDRAGSMLDQEGGLYGNFQASPGYQFRVEEGEKALRSMQAARGGRFGGAAMKEMERYRQGVASQEFDNFTNRQDRLYGAASQSDAMGLQASGQLANIYSNAGSQLAGAQQSLGQQAAGFAYGAGQGAAGLYGQTAGQLADVYGRTGTQLGSTAIGAGQQLGQNEAGYYQGMGDLAWKGATQMGAWGMAAAGAPASMIPTLANSNQATTPYAGAGYAAAGQAVNDLEGLGLAYATGAFDGGGG